MLNNLKPTLVLLLSSSIIAGTILPAAATPTVSRTEGKNPLTEMPLFNPDAARAALPDLERFDAWTQSDSGKLLTNDLLENESTRWLGLFRGLDTKDPNVNRLAQISPVIQQINGDPALKARIKESIDRLAGGTLSAADQASTLAEIVRDLSGAREAVADKVVRQLKSFQDGYAARIKKQGLSREAVVSEVIQIKDGMIDPLDYLYGTTKSRTDAIGDLSRYLTTFSATFMSDVLEKGRETALELGDFESSPKRTFLKTVAPPPPAAPTAAVEAEPEAPSRIIRPTSAELERFGGKTPFIVDSGARTGDIGRIALGNKSDPAAIKTDPVVFPFFPGSHGSVAATDVVSLLEAGNLASDVTYISMYEQGLDQDVDSIISQAKKGKKFIIVADFSQLFPEKVARANALAFPDRAGKARPVKPRRPQYQKLVDAFLAQDPTDGNWRELNLQLYALKGKTSIGINHNKFRIWTFPDGRKVLQVGSYNYTPRSQFNHWENVMFFDSSTPEGAKIVSIFERYHRWQIAGGGAVRFSEDLEPENPDITSPIWRQTEFSQTYHDKDFADVSVSPDGGSFDWLTDLVDLSNQDLYFAVFGFYPPKEFMDSLKSYLKRAQKTDGDPMRVLTDYSQAHNSASMAALKLIMEWKDAEVRVLAGPNEADPTEHHELGEFMHNKLVRARYANPKKVIQLIVGSGSTNLSKNAWFNSFENMVWMVLDDMQRQYELYAQPLSEYMDALWGLARVPVFDRRRPRAEFDPVRGTPSTSTGETQ